MKNTSLSPKYLPKRDNTNKMRNLYFFMFKKLANPKRLKEMECYTTH